MNPDREDPENPEVPEIPDTVADRSSSLLSEVDSTLILGDSVMMEPTKTLGEIKWNKKIGKNVISNQFESLDYDIAENELLIEEEERKGYKYILGKNIMKWVVFLMIGVFTAITASMVELLIVLIYQFKRKYMYPYLEVTDYKTSEMYVPWLIWCFFDLIPLLCGSVLVTYFEPIATGSGIPYIKCYLNGIDLPRVVGWKTLIVKAVGLSCTIGGGVASGKEGPMIHVGSCVANVMTSGRIVCFGRKIITLFRYFRDDKEKRDFVSAGAAAGVSAAFGAPVGGVLFSLEESSSFWNQSLTWMIFFGAVISTFTVNMLLSWIYGNPGQLNHPSLINLGSMRYTNVIYELPIYVLIGLIAGCLGAFWNFCNSKMIRFRARFVRKKWVKLLEVAFISIFSSTCAFLMSYLGKNCVEKEPNWAKHETPSTFCTKEGTYNKVASMWLKTPQAALNAILHDDPALYHPPTLMVYVCIYFFLSCITLGMSTSNGIFVPSLLLGASWGRLIAEGVTILFPSLDKLMITKKCALVAGAATLGGIVRMTISLTVIIMEASDNVTFCFPIITTLICAKWIGDFFNEGIYMIIIRLKHVPFLMFDPPPLANNIVAVSVMNKPCMCVKQKEKVHFLVDLLEHCTHNAFPVVETRLRDDDGPRYGKIIGIILRSQILLMLKRRWFEEEVDNWRPTLTLDTLRSTYGQKITLRSLRLSYEEKECSVNFRTLMSRSPITLGTKASLPKMFRVFRALGLRHLPIVNDTNEAIGIVTRKDLAKYTYFIRKGKLILEKLTIMNDQSTFEE